MRRSEVGFLMRMQNFSLCATLVTRQKHLSLQALLFYYIVLFYIMMMYISTVQHPLLSLVEIVHKGGGWDERDRRLILWYFEEQLKQRYQEFVEVVEVFVNQ